MSNEISLFEKLGGTYTEVEGILYPNIGMDDTDTKSDTASVVAAADIGKYGHLWICYMKENHPDRYRHHVRMGQLHIKAKEVNEEAYEMLDRIVGKYLAKHKPERASLLPAPTDDYTTEYNAYCQRMGYTAEKMKSICYKMTIYDEFMEEYQYRRKYYGVRDDSRSVAVSEKNRGTR